MTERDDITAEQQAQLDLRDRDNDRETERQQRAADDRADND